MRSSWDVFIQFGWWQIWGFSKIVFLNVYWKCWHLMENYWKISRTNCGIELTAWVWCPTQYLSPCSWVFCPLKPNNKFGTTNLYLGYPHNAVGSWYHIREALKKRCDTSVIKKRLRRPLELISLSQTIQLCVCINKRS